MKSWKAVRFGTPEEALRIQELEIPAPGDGQVAIKVRAAGVSLPDLLMIKGQHPLIKSTPFSPGIEVAGTVSAVGNGAPFAVGDRVMTTTAYATGWGGFAEYCLADAARAVLAPSHMTNVEAAGFLVPYKTAQVALVQRAVLQQGETLLVLGATGTSGAAAIQFAKALDAQVIAVSSSSAKLEFCREMGADHVINYKTDNILDRVNELTRGMGADVIFDPVGGTLGNQASKAIARRGRFVLIGFASGSWIQLDPLDIAVRDYSVVGVFSARLTPEELARTHSEVIALAQEGRINTPVGKVFPFQDVPAALTYLTSDDLMGRALLSACTVGPNYHRPVVQTPAAFHSPSDPPQTQAQTESFADLPWWQVFHDPQLQELIRTALKQNYDLQSAIGRVTAARAQVGIVRSNQFPQVSLDPTFSGGKTDQGIKSNIFSLAAAVIFQVDLFGRYRRATEAARAQLLATQDAQQTVILTLVSDVASDYFLLHDLDLQLQITKQTVQTQENSVKLTELRLTNGVGTRLDVLQSRQVLDTANSQIPDLERQIGQTEDAINILLGNYPQGVPRGTTLGVETPNGWQWSETLPPQLPVGLPSELLERRPDIHQAEHELIAANANIGVAKAMFLSANITSWLGRRSFRA